MQLQQLDMLAPSAPVIPASEAQASAPVDSPSAAPAAALAQQPAEIISITSAPYGRCACGQPFEIPGLDAMLCPSCGWRNAWGGMN